MNEKHIVLDVNSIEQGAFVSLHFLYKKVPCLNSIQINSHYISNEGLVWTNATSV